MIRNLGGRKLSRTGAHRRALLRSQLVSLILHEHIETTRPKAKELVRLAGRIISLAKQGKRRSVVRWIPTSSARRKLFDVLAPRYQNRAGGFAQSVPSGLRRGDCAPLNFVRLLS
ncbi:MAG: 50S ribosomal protein L17 [Elusimicrobia bacterium]|nr:50S ribosomal protein L17 [Elusimicrobiota bacterium]